jgi:quercetin dioxygenase-like cupin family protein
MNQIVRTNEVEWKPLAEEGVHGVFVKPLLFDETAGRAPTILLKFEAGATYPLHQHPAGEEIFVIQGDIKLGKDELSAGDYLYTAPGNMHRVSTRNGCVVLLKAPEEVVRIEPRSGREPDKKENPN